MNIRKVVDRWQLASSQVRRTTEQIIGLDSQFVQSGSWAIVKFEEKDQIKKQLRLPFGMNRLKTFK